MISSIEVAHVYLAVTCYGERVPVLARVRTPPACLIDRTAHAVVREMPDG